MKFANRHRALAITTLDYYRTFECGPNSRKILGRIRLAHGSPYGALIAHNRVGDNFLGFTENGVVLCQYRRGENFSMGHHGPHNDFVTLNPNSAQLI